MLNDYHWQWKITKFLVKKDNKMNPVSRKNDSETQKLIDEWLKKNEPQKFAYNQRSEHVEVTKGFYGRKKKKKAED